MKYQDMLKYCEQQRDEDGFCHCCCSCSGACLSNLTADYPFPEGKVIYRGGHHGSCWFEIEKEEAK